jgi:hypothetical protein
MSPLKMELGIARVGLHFQKILSIFLDRTCPGWGIQ